ncbi:transcription termination factor NusA [Alicyclobacillus acidocaldarius]|uniref:Transcription termination/antitermination protein NusA n=1 Tax=Alicyclobacillus acidocaldarius subsp. acidocaldarius (strain ATCC 27009 / DSM 446 / BCRC 14685 / JCM 5260 / KCTC 1825 / NBRC 15652 / NCIMB 11725 / NRRL B-14509 / 104-IA) TaxID=521098 RepID=C8WWI7_ALIAD|nr:transcription termination factor NusA [Alicyclobacillus acidocaldarius]ACV58458.1 NusA antitermination factor [Alicyclobacillus acidocaldarius subsp. acidocaldarius DSM 446]
MNVDFLEALDQLAREKGIDKEVLLEAIEAALIASYRRNFHSAANVRVEVKRDTGEVHVYARKTVVEEPKDTRLEISLDAARDINPSYQIGDVVEIEVTPRDFGRIAAQAAKQVVMQRVKEAERSVIYSKFADREEEVVSGIVSRLEPRVAYIDLGDTEAILPQSEQMASDKLQVGKRLKVFIARVERTSKGPQIVVSRTHPGLLRRLFELEVPEIYEGIVEIKAVAREAGSRSKIAVHSRNPEVDPIGACVGARGSRVQAIVNELNGEKVDIVEWSEDPATFVANALSPAKVIDVHIYEDERVARTVVPDYQLSLAIGKEGQNARLAARLTGWKIDIKSESQMASHSLLDQLEDTNEEEPEFATLSDDWLNEP